MTYILQRCHHGADGVIPSSACRRSPGRTRVTFFARRILQWPDFMLQSYSQSARKTEKLNFICFSKSYTRLRSSLQSCVPTKKRKDISTIYLIFLFLRKGVMESIWYNWRILMTTQQRAVSNTSFDLYPDRSMRSHRYSAPSKKNFTHIAANNVTYREQGHVEW